MMDNQNFFAGGYLGLMMKTTDGGIFWENMTKGREYSFTDIFFINPAKGWAAGTSGAIYHTQNGGQNWEKQNTNTENIISSVLFSDTLNGWAAGTNGTLLRTTNAGQNWVVRDLNSQEDFFNINFFDSQNGLIFGRFGTCFKTTNGGNTWEIQNPGQAPNVSHSFFLNDKVGWISGGPGSLAVVAGILQKTTDKGATWVTQLVLDHYIYGIHFADSLRGWLGAGNGTIQRTTDGGQTWEIQLDFGEEGGMASIFSIDSLHVWASFCGHSGNTYLRKTSDGGQSWIPIYGSPSIGIYDMYFTDFQHGWIAGEGGTIQFTETGGLLTKEKNLVAEKGIDIFPNPAGDYFKIKTSRKILKIRLFDMQGKIISEPVVSRIHDQVDISCLKPGLYTLVIQTETGIQIKKLIRN
jgi:photosystem II stability/assembly factor-like uncharacterized protein